MGRVKGNAMTTVNPTNMKARSRSQMFLSPTWGVGIRIHGVSRLIKLVCQQGYDTFHNV
jgi:hypothetical protein